MLPHIPSYSSAQHGMTMAWHGTAYSTHHTAMQHTNSKRRHSTHTRTPTHTHTHQQQHTNSGKNTQAGRQCSAAHTERHTAQRTERHTVQRSTCRQMTAHPGSTHAEGNTAHTHTHTHGDQPPTRRKSLHPLDASLEHRSRVERLQAARELRQV